MSEIAVHRLAYRENSQFRQVRAAPLAGVIALIALVGLSHSSVAGGPVVILTAPYGGNGGGHIETDWNTGFGWTGFPILPMGDPTTGEFAAQLEAKAWGVNSDHGSSNTQAALSAVTVVGTTGTYPVTWQFSLTFAYQYYENCQIGGGTVKLGISVVGEILSGSSVVAGPTTVNGPGVNVLTLSTNTTLTYSSQGEIIYQYNVPISSTMKYTFVATVVLYDQVTCNSDAGYSWGEVSLTSAQTVLGSVTVG